MRSLPRSWSVLRALFPWSRRRFSKDRRSSPRHLRPRSLAGLEGLEGRSMLAVVTWDGGADGTGTDFLDPVNWVDDVLPHAADTAEIGPASGTPAAIVLSGSTSVAEIHTSRSLTLKQGASLQGTRLIGTDGAALSFVTNAQLWQTSAWLDDVTTNMDMDLGSSSVRVRASGLTLDGSTIRLGDGTGAVRSFLELGGERLSGTGTIVFGANAENYLNVSGSQQTFTIGVGITIRGNSGHISSNGSTSIRNEGTILPDGIPARLTDPMPIQVTTNAEIQTYSTGNTIATDGLVNPLPMSAYQTARGADYADSSYLFPGLAPGSQHHVRLHFADAWILPSWSGLWASINGTQVLSGFNIAAAAGGPNRAVIQEFDATADADGRIRITLSGNRYSFNAIELFRGTERVAYCDGRGAYFGELRIENNAGFENHGSIGASGQGTLTLAGTWGNSAGTVTGTGGTVNLTGTIYPNSLGTWARHGGTVNVSGTIENTGGTLRLDAGTGSWTLKQGTLRGGRFESEAGVALRIGQTFTVSNYLDGVEVAGTIETGLPYGYVQVINDLMMDGGTIRIGDSNGDSAGGLSFSGPQALGGTGEIVFGNSPNDSLSFYGNGQADAEMTIGSGIRIHGSMGYINASSIRVVNEGTIVADASTPVGFPSYQRGEIIVRADDLVNRGSIGATGPGTLSLGRLGQPSDTRTWTNEGTLVVEGGRLDLGGRFSVDDIGTISRNGGQLNITGVVDNAGHTLALPAGTGQWQFVRGGVIRGGAIATSPGASLLVTATSDWLGSSYFTDDAPTLDGVELDTDLLVGSPSQIRLFGSDQLIVRNGLRMDGGRLLLGDQYTNGAAQLMFLGGTQSVTGSGEIVFGRGSGVTIGGDANAQYGSPSGTVTIGAGVTVHGGSGTIASHWSQPGILVNEGTITSDATTPYASDIAYDTARVVDPSAPPSWRTRWDRPVDTSLVADPLPSNAYQSYAIADSGRTMAYFVSGLVSGAAYRVRLHFAEFEYNSAESRLMNVDVNGTRVLENFDIRAAAGALDKAVARVVTTTADASGRIRIAITAVQGQAIISAIDVFAGIEGGDRVAGIDAGNALSMSYPEGIQISPSAFVNRGELAVATGGYLELAPGWSNDLGGHIEVSGGRLALGGSMSLADVSAIHRSGGSVWLNGTFDLGGGTLDLDTTVGPLTVSGGTIRNGRLVSAAGSRVTGSGSMTLDAVTLATDLELYSSPWGDGATTIRNGLTLEDAVVSVGSVTVGEYPSQPIPSSTLIFTNGTQTLTGTGSIVFGANPSNRITLRGSGAAGETFTVGSGVTIRGNSGTIGSDSSAPIALVNNGTILADATVPFDGQTGYDILAEGGTTIAPWLDRSYRVDRTGVIDPVAENAYRSSRYSYDQTGFSYTLNDLLPGQTYRVRLHFVGSDEKTVAVNDNQVLNRFRGPVDQAWVRAVDATADATGRIRVSVGQYVTLSAIELFSGTDRLRFVDAGASLPGGINVSPTSFENRGTLGATGGEALTVSPVNPLWLTSGIVTVGRGSTLSTTGDYRQTAGETRLAGGIVDPAGVAAFEGGSLSGHGTVRANVSSSAIIRPSSGTTAGTLSIEGNYSQSSSGKLDVRVTGPGAADRLTVSGTAMIDGSLGLVVTDGNATPPTAAGYTVLSSAGRTGTFTTFSQSTGNSFAVEYDDTSALLTLDPAGGPVVTEFSHTGLTNLSAPVLRVTFSKPIAVASFTSVDIELTGPSGAVETTNITIRTISETEFELSLPALSDGSYSLALGPGITDQNGNPMPAAAKAALTIDTRGPRVVSTSAADGIATPLSVIDVEFDAPIDPASFTAADVQITTPLGGSVAVASIRQVSPTVYRVSFPKQWYPGDYNVVIGLDVRDPAGNLLDQNVDGFGGESGVDVFSGTVRVGTVDLVVSDVTVAETSTTSGSSVTVSWTTHNVGDSPAVGMRFNQILLTRVSDGGYGGSGGAYANTVIPAGGFQRITASAQLVDGVSGVGDFRVAVTADANSEFEEYRDDGGATTPVRSEDNNTSASSSIITSTMGVYPDLVVRQLRIVESTLTPGGTLTLRWNDTNQGAAAVDNRYWADTILVVDTSTGHVLQNNFQYTWWQSIAKGGAYEQEYWFTLPSDFDPSTATLAITVTVDPWGYIPEYDSSGSLKGNNASTISWASTPTAPDLTVTGLSVVDDPLYAGQSTQIRVVIANPGTGDTGDTWSGQLVVVHKTTGATILDRKITPGLNVAAGSTLTSFIPFDIPAGAEGIGDLEITFTADSEGVVTESNADGTAETNNTRTTTVTSTVRVYADLQVNDVSISPANPQSGGTVTIRWNDVNTGVGSTGRGWTDRVVVVNATTGVELVATSLTASSALAAAGSLAREYSFTLPVGSAGVADWSVTVTTDYGAAVDESNTDGAAETNNTATATFTSEPAPTPDLQVTDLAVSPTSPQSGGTVTIRWNDVNTGPGSTGRGWADRVVVVNTRTGSTLVNDTVVSGAALAGGATLACEYSFTLPAGGVGVGELSITVTADDGTAIDESNDAGNAETNNSASTTVTTTLALAADLQPTGLTVDQSSLQSGQWITLRWQDSNIGTATAAGGWYDRVRVVNTSRSETIVDTYVSIGGLVAAGASSAGSYSFRLPDGIAGVGDLSLEVTTDAYGWIAEDNADGTGEANNTASISRTSSLAPYPDLQVSALSVTPDPLQSSDWVTIRWTDVNTGNAAVPNGWYDDILVRNETTGVDIAHVWHGYYSALDAGANVAREYTIRLPHGAAGTGTISFRIRTDDAGYHYEDNADGTGETNNTASISRTSSLAPYPDLQVSALSVSPGTLHSGDTVTVRWTETNSGDAAAQAAWYDRIKVVNTTTGETIVDQAVLNFTTIAAGGSLDREATFTLPEGTRGTGQLSFEVIADIWNYVVEYNAGNTGESNNTRSTTVTSLPTPTPDLAVGSVTAPTTTRFGDSVQISWVEQNVGDLVASTGWQDAVYLSANDVYDGGDTRLAILPASGSYGPLDAGASETRTATVQLPLVTWLNPGSYRLIVVANSNGTQRELGRDNNVAASAAVSVTLPPLPDLVVSEITAPAKGFSGQDVTVRWIVRNQGTADYTGPLTDAIRLSSDTTLGGDLELALLSGTVTIPAGGSISRAQTVTLPVALSGNRRFVVETDVWNQAFEHANDANNASIDDAEILVEVPPLPNLRVSSVTVPSSGFSSAPVTVSWSVTNSGTGATNAPIWYDGIYLSTDDVLDAGDVRLGSLANPSYLGAGDGYSSSTTITLPRGISGAYRILIKTDDFNAVYEGSSEGDNTRSGAIDVTLTPPPDLQIASVSAPSIANSGSPMTVGWTVRNGGAGQTLESSWVDSVWISTDTIFDGADRLLGTFARSGGRLAAGATYSGSGSVSLPIGVSGSFYVFVQTDAANQVYEHTAEDNNTGYRATPVTVNLTPPPDLVVSSVLTPATARAGQAITVNYRVSNDGASATPENVWVDELYLSTDASFDPATDTLLASQSHYGILEADGGSGVSTYDASFTATLPRSISGSYSLFVVTDRARRVFELTESRSNNVSAAKALAVSFLPPDLVTDSLTAQTSAASGGSIQVGYRVRNQGTGPTNTDAWTDRIVLSTDASYGNADDIVLANVDHIGALSANTNYSVSERSVQIPLTVPSGNYFLFAVADIGDRVYESTNENNNATAARAITVTRTTADLTVTAVGATPATLAAGSSVSVNWTVTNSGAAATNANWWNDSVWLSTDANLGDANDVFLGTVQRNDPLAAGGTYSVSQAFILSGTLVPGSYRVLVATDSTNRVVEGSAEGNNVTAAAGSIAVTAQDRPNLAVSAVTPAALAASAGQLFSVSWTEGNGGVADATGRWYDSVYLSLDQTLDSSDRYLGYVDRTGPLASDQTASVTGIFRLPQGVAGGFYVFVVADASGAVTESTESDNTAFGAAPVTIDLPPPADLVVGTITVPANVVSGATISVTYTVRNDGTNAASGAWTDSLFLSADDAWDSGDVPLGRVDVYETVGHGESYTRTLTTLAPVLTPGNYKVIVRSDIRNTVPESNESNNIGASLDRVTFDVPELGLGSTPLSGTLAEGSSACYRIVVPTASETVRVTFDSSSDDGDTTLFIRRGSMPTASSFDLSSATPFQADQTLMLSADTADTYYLLVQRRSGSGAFTLRAETVPFSIATATPAVVGTGGEVTLRIDGARFTSDTAFQIVAGDATVTGAVRTVVVDSTVAYVTFDTAGLAAGSYSLRASSGGETAIASAPLVLRTGTGADVVAQFEGPISVRPNTTYAMRVLYGNGGDRDVSAPLLIVTGPAGMALGSTASDLATGGQLQVLATSADGPAGTLRPGSQSSTTAAFSTLSAGDAVEFTVRAVTASDTTKIEDADWLALEHSARPAGLADSDWTTFWGGFRASVGVTWGDYVQTVEKMATATGGRPHDVRALFAATLAVHPAFDAALGSKGMQPASPSRPLLPELPPAPAFGTWRAADGLLCAYVGHFRPRVVVAIDPNDIVNPVGFGAEQWIPADKKIPYTIRFENAASATAPAQVVRVTQPLDPDLNANSFRLGDFGFDLMTFEAPENVAYYTKRLDLTATRGYAVDVAAGIDVVKRQAFWTFTTIDPATGEQPVDASLGFLPVDDPTGKGNGFVSYTIKPRSMVVTGSRIDAGLVDAEHDYRATIVFDTEAPILTPSVFNTLDADAPSSVVATLPASVDTTTFPVAWEGTDIGSGLAAFSVWVSVDGGAWTPWLENTTDRSADYVGTKGHSYAFYAIAVDNVGNVEAAPLTGGVIVADAVTRTPGALVAFAPGGALAGVTTIYGTASGTTTIAVTGTNLTADIAATAPAGFEVSSDGTTFAATATFASSSGVVSGTLSVRLAANTGAGTYSGTVTLSTDGAPAVDTAMPASTVDRKALTILGASATSRAYDGTRAIVVSGGTLSGVVSGDNVSLGGTPTGIVVTAGAGTAKLVTVTGYSLGGTSIGNYTFTQPAGITTDITAKELTISGVTVQSRVYDGGTGVTLTGTAAYVGLVTGESFAVVGTPIAAFTTKNVGSGKSVVASGYAAPTANYIVTQPALNGTITAKPLTVTGAAASGRPYDGTTAVTITGTLAGVVSGDAVTHAGGGRFATSTVGTGKTVTADLTLNGVDAVNYELAQPAGLSAAITPRILTVTGAAVVSRPYDGTTAATITGTLAGVVSGETVTLVGTGSFTNRAASTGKSVTAAVTLAGTTAANYLLTQPTGVTGTITPKTLTLVNAAASNKPYDGTSAATITGTLSGLVAGDQVGFVGAGTFASPDRGTGIAVTPNVTLYSPSGSAFANYALTQPATLYADITIGQQSINTVNIGTRLVGTSLTMPATSSTGQSVSYATSNSAVASGSGNVITLLSAGWAKITATAAGTTNYEAFSATQTVKVLASADPVSLVAGDVMILGHDATSATGTISLLFLRDLTPGTTFFVSDNDVLITGGAQFADLDEAEAQFTVRSGQVIAAGTVVTLPWRAKDAGTGLTEQTTSYDWAVNDAAPSLAVGGDEIYLYNAASVTSQKPTGFIDALVYGNATGQRPSGLIDNQTFIRTSGDTMRYKPAGAVYSGAPATLRAAIGKPTANWESGAAAAANYTFLLPQPQLVTFEAIPAKTYGDPIFTLLASAFSGGTVMFVSSDPTVASIAGNTVTILKAGGATITALMTGDDSYLASSASQALAVARKGITVVADAKVKTYGEADPTLTYQATLVGTDVLSGALARSAGSAVGSYAISVGTLANANYDIAYTGANLSVNAKALTITAGDVTKAANQTLVGGAGSTAFTAAGLVADETVGSATIAYGAAGAAGYLGGAIGTYANQVTPSVATGGTFSASNYAIAYAAGAIIVNASPTISVSPDVLAALSTTYGTDSALRTFSVAGSTLASGVITISAPVGFQVSKDGTSFASSQTVSITAGIVPATSIWVRIPATTAAGTWSGDVTISGGGATAKTVALASSTVAKKDLTISGLAFQSRSYDGTTNAPTPSAAAFSGLVNGDNFIPSGSVSWAFADKNAAADKPLVRTGDYAAPTANYTVTQPTRSAGIVAKALSILADAKSKVFGAADPALSFTTSGLVAGDTLSGNLSRAAGGGVGSYAINEGSLSAGSNYTVAFVPAALTITKRPVTIVADAVGKVAGQADPALTWKVSSVTPLASGDTSQTAFSGNLVRSAGEAVGSYAISKGTLDGANYEVTFTGASFTIVAASSPLKVNGVYVKGSSWTAGYQALSVFTTIGATNVGWALADGATQLTDAATIGWNNVNRISIRFNQPIAQPVAAALSLVYGGSTAAAGSTTPLGSPTLLEGGVVAQWTVTNLVSGKYQILADASKCVSAADASRTLDGEWAIYAGSFATGSGDGSAGGNFVYDFDVLVGNVATGDINSTTKAEALAVNMNDNSIVTGQVGKVLTALNFRCDIDGSGRIDSTDLAAVQARIKAGVASSLSSTYYVDPLSRRKRTT